MTPPTLDRRLQSIGRTICRWDAECRVLFWGAILAAALFCAGMADLWFHFAQPLRVAAWVGLIAVLGAGAWRAQRALATRRSAEAVAAGMEHHFPELDNRLINYIQFSRRRDPDAMVSEYLSGGPPRWEQLDINSMKNRVRFRRFGMALAVAVAVMALPLGWSAHRWSTALRRIVNPFSSLQPAALARIVDVAPGDTRVVQGTAVELICTAQGERDQPVLLELWPQDDRKSRIQIGRISMDGEQTFRYRIPSVTSETDYRFAAGGIAHHRFTVKTRPPLALVSCRAAVTPPAYMNLQGATFDALSDSVEVPDGAHVTLEISANFPLVSASVKRGPDAAASFNPNADRTLWNADLPEGQRVSALIIAVDTEGYDLKTMLRWTRLADHAPKIEVHVPAGKATLGPGQLPLIRATVTDDFGLTEVYLEQLDAEALSKRRREKAQGLRVHDFDISGTELAITWQGESRGAGRDGPLVYRLVAVDNRAGEAQRTVSRLLVFEKASRSQSDQDAENAAAKMAHTLAQLIKLQKNNLADTRRLQSALTRSGVAEWQGVAQKQGDVRRLAGVLIVDRVSALGPMKQVLRKLFQNEMAEAIDVLERVSLAKDAAQRRLVERSVMLETKILEMIAYAAKGKAKASDRAARTGVLALLDAIVKGQTLALAQTRHAQSTGNVPAPLVDKQDDLASDVVAFVAACRREANRQRSTDAAFADLVEHTAAECERRAVHDNMIRAAEALDEGEPARAVPIEEKVLGDLLALQSELNRWRAEQFLAESEELIEALDAYQDKIEKLRQIQAQVVETMRELDRQEDALGKDQDLLEEELDEIRKNMKEALMEIPVDLNIFADLPVGNDLVEDVWQVFEEIDKADGAESADAPVHEMGTMKDDKLLDMLEMAAQRADEMEMWLSNAGDKVKRNMEDFDQAEFENAGEMNVMPMPAAMEDLIGDLIEEAENVKKEADDSATNQGTPDMVPGWQVEEGEFSNFSAQGKSGNAAPDHKEQDGRSNIGRQGMSDGETTAGAGAIEKGDENIDKRMTQDPNQGGGKVEEENNAEAVATGGGKKTSGHSEETGMPGQGPRRDSDVMSGGRWDDYLRRNAEELYAKSSMMHLRTGPLDEAVNHIQQVSEAYQRGDSYLEIRELQQKAIDALRRTQAELGAGVSDVSTDSGRRAPDLEDQLAGGNDDAPEGYEDLVSEYFKTLNDDLL